MVGGKRVVTGSGLGRRGRAVGAMAAVPPGRAGSLWPPGGPRGWASWRDSWPDLATTRSPTPFWGSTLGAARFHGRVRNGVGWCPRAVVTRSSQESGSDDRCQRQMSDQVGASRAPDVARHRSELVVKLGAWGQRSVVRSWPPALSAGRRRLLSSGASAPGEVSREALGHGRRPPRLAANRRLAGGGRRVQEPRPAGARSENPLRVGYRPSAYLSPLRAWGWVRARHSSD